MSIYTDKYNLAPLMILKIKEARYEGDFKILLTFNNNETHLVDLKSYIMSCNEGTVFEPLQDVKYFKNFTHNPGDQTISWPNEADIAPEFLYDLAVNQNKSA